MEINNKKIINELETAKNCLRYINKDNLNFKDHTSLIECEVILGVILNLLKEDDEQIL